MNEPTREQIKEAFKGTIARWERIVEDPHYYHASKCQLCLVYSEDSSCHKYCPIRSYGKHSVCYGTPHDVFLHDNTPENALAELNFLRKVYIWWMEKEANKIWEKHGIGEVKEEKKKEWEDITIEISNDISSATLSGHHFFRLMHRGQHVGNLVGGKFAVFNSEYKAEYSGHAIRILKKI